MKYLIHYTHPINGYYVGQLIDRINQALANNPSAIEVHFSSQGGSLHDGFTLYNYLRSVPFPVHMHNIGSVESIAVIAFLAAGSRTACEYSRFLLHGLNWTYGAGTYAHGSINEHALSLDFYAKAYVQAFNERTEAAQEPVDVLNAIAGKPVIVPASGARAAGLVTESAVGARMIEADAVRFWIPPIV